MRNRRLHPPRHGLLAALVLMLVYVSAAATASTPLLQLGPITVADNTATVAGTLASGSSTATLTVNGQPVGLDAAGAFTATVPLNGASTLALALRQGGSSQQTTFQVPLTGNLIPAGVLDSLEQAGISLLAPTGIGSGDPLTVSGGVLDHGNLSSLTLNGKDVLGALGSGGTFTVQVPGTTKVITLSATDKNGTSEIDHDAGLGPGDHRRQGRRRRAFARIAFSTKNVRKTHRVRMIVTVRDLRGSLVKGATVSVKSLKRGRLLRTPKSGVTGPKGSTTIVLPLRAVAFGKRLTVNTVAKTPSAKVSRKGGVRIPKTSTRGTREPASGLGSRHDDAPAGPRRPAGAGLRRLLVGRRADDRKLRLRGVRQESSLGPAAARVPELRRAALELETTSPFHGELDEPLEAFAPELDAWHQEDLVSTTGLARGSCSVSCSPRSAGCCHSRSGSGCTRCCR